MTPDVEDMFFRLARVRLNDPQATGELTWGTLQTLALRLASRLAEDEATFELAKKLRQTVLSVINRGISNNWDAPKP